MWGRFLCRIGLHDWFYDWRWPEGGPEHPLDYYGDHKCRRCGRTRP